MNPTTDQSTNRQWSEGTSPLCGVINTGDRKMKDEHTAKVLRQIADEIERVGVERAHEGFEVWNSARDKWEPMHKQCIWADVSTGQSIRPRPRTIQIGDHTVPEPLRVAPEIDQEFFFPDPAKANLSERLRWSGDRLDQRLLKRGMVHLDPESAAQHARALIAVSGGEVGE